MNRFLVEKLKGLLFWMQRKQYFGLPSLIFAMCNGFVVQYDKSERSIKSSQGVGGSFAVFDNNLKKL